MSQNTFKTRKSCCFGVCGGLYVKHVQNKEKVPFRVESQKQRFIDENHVIFENIALSASLEEVRQAPRGGGWGPFWTSTDPQSWSNRVESGPESVQDRGSEVTFWT